MGNRPHKHTSDPEVWEAFQNGEQWAFLELFDRFYHSLFAYGMQICQHQPLTDDCIQEMFLELWEKRAQVSPVTRVKAWLFKILKRKLTRALDRERRQTGLNEQEHPDLFVFSREQELSAQEGLNLLQGQLSQAISELTTRQRETLYLRFYEGLSYEEVAEVSTLSVGRVYNLVCESIKKLRHLLQDKDLFLVIFLLLKISVLHFF